MKAEHSRSLLNSLPAHVAVLDRAGRITAVNDAWIDFARANGARSVDQLAGGADYLDVCRAAGSDSFASAATAGIEQVLAYNASNFRLEYPCHSPAEQRWFLMTVSRPAEGIGGAIVCHTDISEQKRAEAALRESEKLYRAIGESIDYGIWICDPQGRNIYVSESFLKLVGITRSNPGGRHGHRPGTGAQSSASYGRARWRGVGGRRGQPFLAGVETGRCADPALTKRLGPEAANLFGLMLRGATQFNRLWFRDILT